MNGKLSLQGNPASPKNILKAQMALRGLGYVQLEELLREGGMRTNEPNIRSKIARGTFTASFFLACLRAMDVKVLRLDD